MKRIWERFALATTANLGLKLLSVVIALALWIFVNAGQKASERAIEVPVEFRNIPSDLMVTNPSLDQVEVRMMGPPAVLSTIDSDRLKVTLDLEGARPGTSTFRLTPDFFSPPRGVRVTRVSPSIVNLKLEAVAVRSLPVKVRVGEKPPFGYKITAVEASPEMVKVQGAASEVNRMSSVDTLPFELEGTQGKTTREVRLDSGGKGISFSPDRVTVSLVLEEEWITREFQGVKVKAKDSTGEYKVNPGQVYLRLSGPKRVLAPLRVGEEHVYLDLKGLEAGNHTLPLTLRLPPEVKVIEQRPSRFRVRIDSP